MKRQQRRRLFLVMVVVLGVGAAVALVMSALEDNLRYFVSPSEIRAGLAPQTHTLRLGGLVVAGSVRRSEAGADLTVRFDITDGAETIPVAYTGILPDLFRAGQGIVATGRLGPDGVFAAQEVLAKHDENYMPREVQAALDAAEGVADKGAALRRSAGGSL